MTDQSSLHEQMRRRALQLQTAAEVSRAASSILNLDELLPRVVDLIRERFDLYYVGLFLVEEIPQGREDAGRWAVLRAGTGEAGQKMIQAGHKLAIGGQSMIGGCVASGQARIALDVGEEAVRFDNPLLPLTRSEMALPLISRGRIIGAMTIQSAQPAAFSTEDITVLQTMADQLANAIENAHLFQERERRITELAIVNEIGQALSTALDLDELLEAVHQQVSRLFDTTNFYIATYTEGDDHWATAFHLEHGQRQPSAHYSITAGLTGHIIRTRQPILLHSVAENIAFHQALGKEMIGEIARSWLGVPLLTADKLVGVMAIQNYEHEYLYTEQDLALFSTVAAQVANALDNQRLLAETRRRAREMEVINEVGQAITSVLDLDEVLRQIVDTIKERFGYFFVGILLREGNHLVFRSGSKIGRSDTRWERGDVRLSLDDQSLNVAVVIEGRPILVNDVSTDPRYKLAEGLEPVRAELDVPIVVKGQLIGTLTVQSDRPNAFDQTDLRLLQSLANQAGVAIENARLFRETQNRVRALGALYRSAQAVSSELDLDTLTDRLVNEACRLVEADYGVLVTLDPATGGILHFKTAGIEKGGCLLSNLPQGKGVLKLLLEGQAVRVDDLRQHPAFEGLPSGHLPIVSFLGLPLLYQGQVRGLLGVSNRATGPKFDAADEDLLGSFAAQATISLENVRLFHEAQARLEQMQILAEELAVLNEMGAALTAMLDTEAVIENLYLHTARLMDMTSFFIALYEPTTDTVSFPLAVEQGQRARWRPRQAGKGLTEYIIRTGEPVLIREEIGPWLEQHGIQQIGKPALSWLGVPIKIGERVLGVIAVQSYETPRLFSEHHRDLLSAVASQAAIALENARLFEEIQLYAEEQATLRRIIETLGSSLEMQEMLHAVLREVLAALNLDAALVSLRDETTDRLYLAAQQGLPDAMVSQLEQNGLAGTLYELAFETGKTIHIADVRQGAPVNADDLIRYELYSYTGMPLVHMGRHLGAICLFNRAARSLTERELALLAAASRQIGIGMENARLFAETNRHAAQLQSLYVTAVRLNTERNIPDLLQIIVEQAVTLLEAEAGGFYLYDPESDELVFSIGTGYFTEFVGYRLKPGEGLAGQVFESRRLMTIEDYQSWPGKAALYEGETRLETILGVPLLGREGVLGVLDIAGGRQKHTFSAQDIWLAELFATQAAIALENARLFDQIQTTLAHTESLYHTSRLITAAQTVDEVLAAVLEYAHHLAPDRCLIALLDDPEAAPADRQVEVRAIWDRAGKEAAFLGNRFTPAHIPPIGTLGPTDRLIVDDFATSDRVDERTRATFRYLGVGAAAIIPLAVGGRLLGWLLVETIGRPYNFTQRTVDALHSIASQAAVALQNLNRLQEIQARAEQERAGRAMLALRVREVDCLNDIGRKIDETPPIPDFLQWAAERIPAALQYSDLCRVAIEFEGQVYGAAEAVKLPRQMVQQMRIGGTGVGRVYVAYTQDYDFLDEESALLGDITRRVSGYIENRRLIEQIQARAEREKRLRTITDRIRRGTDVESIIHISLEELNQMLGTSQLIVRLGSQEQLRSWAPDPTTEVNVIRQATKIGPGSDDSNDQGKKKKGGKSASKPKH